MKISLIYIGATQEYWLKDGIALFEKRIRHYLPFEMVLVGLPRNSRNLPPHLQKEMEGKAILQALEKADHPVLLDVVGKKFSSEAFSGYIQQVMNKGVRNLVFVIGGPYGFSDEVYKVVKERLSLSEMTFSHQLIRLVFLEQLYRAFTIIRGEPYHHAG